jgi:hypothetical protein
MTLRAGSTLISNSKSEIRNPKQARNEEKAEKLETDTARSPALAQAFAFFFFASFGFVSDFVLRISNFKMNA